MVTDYDLRLERRLAYRYALALRHLLGTGLEPITYDDDLCDWSGDLLPLEAVDRRRSTQAQTPAHRLIA